MPMTAFFDFNTRRKQTVSCRTSGNGWGSSGWNSTQTKRAGSSSALRRDEPERRGEGKPETFDFLGFTHVSREDRNGNFTVKRTTARKRLRAKLRQLKQQLRGRLHDPVAQTGKWLKSVVQDYFNYHAVPGNLDSLRTFRVRLLRLWRTTLRRRSQRSRPNWDRINLLAARWLPLPPVLHPWPMQRFAASHPRPEINDNAGASTPGSPLFPLREDSVEGRT